MIVAARGSSSWSRCACRVEPKRSSSEPPMPRSTSLTEAISATVVLPAASRPSMRPGRAGLRSRVNWLLVARLPAPSSSTCPQAHRILPWWSLMACSQICSSSEVSRASFTSRPSSNSGWMDERHRQLLLPSREKARRLRFAARVS
jgi:hypothetical protein